MLKENLHMYVYQAVVVRVYDGDTITVRIDLGFGVSKIETLRLFGIDTPEVRGDEREAGLKSRDWLRTLILNKEIIVKTYKDKKGKYGRYLADIFIEQETGPVNINDWLVRENLAERKEY
jgi:micrococcal nuclease